MLYASLLLKDRKDKIMSTKYTKKTETSEKEVEVVEDNKKDEV